MAKTGSAGEAYYFANRHKFKNEAKDYIAAFEAGEANAAKSGATVVKNPNPDGNESKEYVKIVLEDGRIGMITAKQFSDAEKVYKKDPTSKKGK